MHFTTKLPSGNLAVSDALAEQAIILYEATPEQKAEFEAWYVEQFGEEARTAAREIVDAVLERDRVLLDDDGQTMASAPGDQPSVGHVAAAHEAVRDALRRGERP